ncbi:hypothetical protein B0T10DRAFT_602099 [Thelonectria olida]|uniref:Uncharacterized protein n=1 Tax=Thelonectria olida TaxID=1576542 RepID=A0A9P9ATU4_9HYPO|nr:hypothetical protein B0T10DRAFT_602099 [Thelonectria olida]
MLAIPNAIQAGPKFLHVVLAVGSATVAGGFVRSQRSFDRYSGQYTAPSQPVAAKPVEPRSKFFDMVLESIFA